MMDKSMIVILIIFLIVIAVVGILYADIFVVCDPQDGVTSYIVELDGKAVTVPPDPNNRYGFMYNITGIADGAHNIRASACNMWDCSGYADFGFVVERCGKPQNIKIMKMK